MTDAVHVRPARSGDVAALVALVHAAFAQYEGQLEPPSGAHAETIDTINDRLQHGALVAKADGEPVGCLFYREREQDLYVGRLAVLPAWRGRGIARLLLDAAEDVARDRGVESMTVGVRFRLPENIGFFAALGFHPYDVGTHDGFRHPTFLWMRRLLP